MYKQPLKQHILINYSLADTVSAKCVKTIYHAVLNFNLKLYFSSLGMRILLFMINNIVFRIYIKHFKVIALNENSHLI